MQRQAIIVALALGLLAVVQVSALQFPYSAVCKESPRGYSVDYLVTERANNTYCFTIQVATTGACSDYCCRADLRKFELNVNPSCRIPGVRLSSTLNGRPTPTQPTLDPAPQTPAGVILRITNLGLNMNNADGAEICVSLGASAAGRGCLTLENLCVPPPGGVPGQCNVAVLDSNIKCCPVDIVGPQQPAPIIPPINCSCDYNTGSTPFVAEGSVVSTSNNRTSLHCFPITTVTNYLPGQCGSVDRLLKIEMYAKQSLSSAVNKLYLYPATGAPVALSASWNGANSNTLKFTPVNWSISQATGARVCVELKQPATIRDFCFGDRCSFFLFNANRACCPHYTVSL